MKKKPTDETLFLLIHNWLKIYLPTERAASPNTISSYRDALNQYLTFLAKRNGVTLAAVTFEMMCSESLNAFLDHLQNDLNLSKATRNSRLAALRAFIQYASGCKPEYISTAMDVAKIKSQRDDPFSKVEYLTESAAKAILATPDISTKIGRRDRTILVMLYDTGARISGLLGIRLADLRMDSTAPTVTVVEKGNVRRTIPISKETMPILKQYIAEFHKGVPITSTALLFYVEHKTGQQRVCANTIRRRIDKYVIEARVKCQEVPEHVHPHMWRHTRAMHLYQHGMPLELVGQWLGHKNTETTKVYAYADAEHKRKAIEKAMLAGAPKVNGTDEAETVTSSEAYCVTDEELLKKLYGLA